MCVVLYLCCVCVCGRVSERNTHTTHAFVAIHECGWRCHTGIRACIHAMFRALRHVRTRTICETHSGCARFPFSTRKRQDDKPWSRSGASSQDDQPWSRSGASSQIPSVQASQHDKTDRMHGTSRFDTLCLHAQMHSCSYITHVPT